MAPVSGIYWFAASHAEIDQATLKKGKSFFSDVGTAAHGIEVADAFEQLVKVVATAGVTCLEESKQV